MAAKKGLAPLKPLGLKPVGQKGQQPKPASTSKDVTLPVPPANPGRPKSNLADYLIKSPDKMINTTPDVMDKVQQQFLTLKHLPPGLAPKGLRDARWHYTDTPTAMEDRRRKEISRGFGDRIRQGKSWQQ